ncbi:glycosyltransferase family 4 protein [Agrococcus sp. Marseille-P2731]|uniref:glycosyltransferase family 4 protein n=1 Tax=Agrococcus sp. Marseille-P2731 TaxID=1841862 RepID=UPI0009301AB4|nr:glycosyltransferase family 4 protein [Agrococcus sp. Marseille-P2731]
MKILLLTHYYAPENSAPQRRWSALIERFTSAGHEVDVICPPPHYPSGRLDPQMREAHGPGSVERDEAGARVFRVSFLRHDGRMHTRTLDHVWVAAATARRARRLIDSGAIAPDVIVATAPALPSLVAGRALARRYSIPLVAEMRDAWPDLVSHVAGFTPKRGLVQALKRVVHEQITGLQRDAARVVTTTESFAAVLLERGVTEVAVIRNGTSVARYRGVPERSTGHPELRALYMGTIGRSQGLEVVVRAAARLRDAGVPLQVRLVGHGVALPRLRELNRALGNPVEILGGVPGSEVVEHYAWADTCIVSLRDWAPFAWTVPSKLYELMASGRHMTAIVAGESAQLVREAGSGDIVLPGDVQSLVELWRRLQADGSRLDVGDRGRAWAARNADYDAIANRYLAVLQSAVRPSPAPR